MQANIPSAQWLHDSALLKIHEQLQTNGKFYKLQLGNSANYDVKQAPDTGISEFLFLIPFLYLTLYTEYPIFLT